MVMSAGSSRALESSLDGSQLLPLISDGPVGECQQPLQAGLLQQKTFDLEAQGSEVGTGGIGH